MTLRYPLYSFYALTICSNSTSCMNRFSSLLIVKKYFPSFYQSSCVSWKLLKSCQKLLRPFYCYLNGRDLHETLNCTRETLRWTQNKRLTDRYNYMYVYLTLNIVAAFRGMRVLPVKHSYAWLPRKRDYQESVTTGQTHGQTDAGQSDPYVPLCFVGNTKMIMITYRYLLFKY